MQMALHAPPRGGSIPALQVPAPATTSLATSVSAAGPVQSQARKGGVSSSMKPAASAKEDDVPKKSADELAAAAVLLNLTAKDETSGTSTPQEASLASEPDETSCQEKKGVGYKKAVTKKNFALSVQQRPPDAIYCHPTTTAPPPPVAAPASLGHVSDENSASMEDTSSVGNSSSRAQSPAGMMNMDDAKWYSGSISLSLPEDDDVLSPLHCFMRKYCVEAFSASPEDVATPRYGKSHGFKVEVGQVGIRCLYCKDLPVGKRPERAVCYPSSLRNIYHSIETWQRRHSLVCTHISPWVRKSIVELMESSKTRAGGRRQYWEDSAKRLGMVDTPRGVRFIRPPGDMGGEAEPEVATHEQKDGGEAVVREEDKDLVTDYLFLLMEQMQSCFFTEEDRTGGRSKIKNIPLKFPGYECRHCHGRAGFGRYFPSSVAALSLANSDRNVFNHLQKCRRCPPQIKKELLRLSKEQSQSKNRRGLRKLFFSRIWERMHGKGSQDGGASSNPSN